MKKVSEILTSYTFFVVSLIFATAVIIYGLFYTESPSTPYYILLGFSLILFFVSLCGLGYRGFKDLVKDYKRHGNIYGFIYDFFASIKLAIFIMIVLGILSMLGSTYIEQNREFDFYVNKFGVEKAYWFWKLWLTDVFSSWYYILFIVLLAINLIVCSIKRLPGVWRYTFGKERFMKLTESMEKRLKAISLRVKADEETIVRFLSKKGFKVFIDKEDGKTYIYGEKGRYSRLGVYIVHFGLLVILGGALIDAFFGLRGTVIVPEGDKSNILIIPAENIQIKLPFYIEVTDFRIVPYGDESPQFADAVKSFESDLKIIRDGKVVAEGMTMVNGPFDYDGYRIFQATYGLTGNVLRMGVAILDKEKVLQNSEDAFLGRVEVGVGKVAEFRDMLISVDRVILNVNDPAAGFRGDIAPAVILKVLKNRKSYNVPVIYDPRTTVFVQYNEIEELKDFPYFLLMDGFEPQYFSGLQVSKNPGTNIIWFGSVLLVGGMMLAFYTVHRKVWMRLEDGKLFVAFYSHKFKEEFKKSFIKELEEIHDHRTS